MDKKRVLNDKRNYICRKKYLHDCALHIKAAIDFMSIVKGNKIDNEESQKQATLYAQQIEAVCWSPRSQMSAENYQKLMQTKTREITCTILKKTLPFLDINQLQKIASSLLIEHIRNHQTPNSINLDLLNSINVKASITGSDAPHLISSTLLTSQTNENASQIKSNTDFIQATSNLVPAPILGTESILLHKKILEDFTSKFKNLKEQENQNQHSKPPQKKYNKESNLNKDQGNSKSWRLPISASDSMSAFEYGDGSPNNPYFIPNLEHENNFEERTGLSTILLDSDELIKGSAILPSALPFDVNEGMPETDYFIDALII